MRLKYAVLATTLAMVLALLLVLFAAVPAFASVDLIFRFEYNYTVERYEPGRTAALYFTAANNGTEDVEAAMIMPLPAGTQFRHVAVDSPFNLGDARCAMNEQGEVVCFRTLRRAETWIFHLVVTMPPGLDGLRYLSQARIVSAAEETKPSDNVTNISFFIYRTFEVTTGDDFAAGSLRDAITNANARCDETLPCKIRFAGATTIRPRAPLPIVTGCDLVIDGGTPYSSEFTAPRAVELVGEDAGPSNGLMLGSRCTRSDSLTVTGLAIGGFAFNGIAVTGRSAQLTQNFIERNGFRGVAVESDAYVTIVQNEISGNRYSGIAVWKGYAYAGGNRIGLAADGSPLGNGASGIFTDGGTVSTSGNTIGYNHDAGIGTVSKSGNLVLTGDRFISNGGLPIDWYLDGPTSVDPNGKMPGVSTITDAYFDPQTGLTMVIGTLGTGAPASYVAIYAINGSETKYIGSAQQVPDFTAHTFRAGIRGDYRGSTLAVTTQKLTYADGITEATSELSTPVIVH